MPDRAPAIIQPTAADEVARPARDAARAPHADIGGPVAGRSRPGLTGHVGHDRRVLRSLQRRAGNVAVSSLVPKGVTQPVIQRQTDEEKKLLADEELAWSAAQGKVNAAALFVTHEDAEATVRLHDRLPETSTLTLASLVDRKGGELKRKSFDSAGAAAALAATMGGPAIALKQDRFYFAASVAGGSMVRDRVWKVQPRLAGIVAVIGDDGLQYPLNTPLVLPKQDKAADVLDVDRAAPVDAAGMRKIAGVKSDEDWAAETAAAQQAKAQGQAPTDPKSPERAQIPPERQEAFIEAYFRARAMELLGANLRQLLKMEEDFKPGQGSGDAMGVSPGAKALIDTTRDQGSRFREILEKEAVAQRYYDLLGWRHSFGTSASEVVVEGKPMVLSVAKAELKTRIDKVKADKDDVLSRFPMLALMVERERGARGFLAPAGENVSMLWKSEIDKPTLAGYNQYDVSSFGKGAGDEALRKEFFEKLCAVEKAVRQATTKVIGEGAGFLYGMAGLRTMVLADLAGNPELRAKAEEILRSHAIKSAVVNVVNAAIEIGLFFVPGVGPLLSAAAGLGQAAEQASQSLDQWSVSKASVDPTRALVDQQEASDSLFWDTVFLAAAAADFGAEAAQSLAKGGKALTEAEKTAKGMGARPAGEAARRKVVREAEERKFWQPRDVPAGVQPPVKVTKPEPAPLTDGFKASLGGLGILVDAAGALRVYNPQTILSRAGKSWTKVKGTFLGQANPADKAMGEYLMWNMITYRRNAAHAILEHAKAEVAGRHYKPGEAVLEEFESVGTISLTSDMDFTVKGPYAHEIVEVFNQRFRQRIVDCESAVAFDTNVYTRPGFMDTPFDLPGGGGGRKLDPVHDRALIADQERLWKEFSGKARGGAGGAEGAARPASINTILAEAEKLYPTDFRARMAHVNNFNQEAASHIVAADTMLAKGPVGIAEWASYKASILRASPPDSHAHQLAVLGEVEARAMSNQQQTLAELNRGRPPSEWITPEQMAKDLAAGSESEAYQRIQAAKTRIYEQKLGKVSAEQQAYRETRAKLDKLRKAFQGGSPTPEQEAELLRLQSELHAQAAHVGASQSAANYFAPGGAYQAQGTYLHVVQNLQKAKNLMDSPAYGVILSGQARDACFELLGFVIAHPGATIDDGLAAAKSLERANLAYMSHPLAKGGSPAVLGLAGQVVVAKREGPEAALKVIMDRYGMAKDPALAAFARDVQAAGAQLRGQMARVSGQPVPAIEEAWMQAVQSGRAATLLMYAALAASKSGAASRGSRSD